MRKIVECVPNFSEGQNKDIIEAIAKSIRDTPGCTLLDVDPGFSTNRTVYTFVGDPDSIVEGAINSARKAKELIDMRHQHGEHPRMGALDVCPFVPVANVTMEECVSCSKEFGRRASEELGIPIYLYEEASEKDYRKKLPDIRKGEYEGLAQKIIQPDWAPDYGPAKFIPEWGATATGARFFLIAYNVNLLATHNQAHRIALDLREAGRDDGKPGLFKEVKGMGWWVEEYNMAQGTFNLTNYKVTAPHILFEEFKKRAEAMNLGVAGSELVGLIPLEAMLMAADYYIQKENLFILEESQKIKLVIERLGLNSCSKFNPEERIIEYMLKENKPEPLADSTVREFVKQVSARTAAPGGGSVSALLAALGVGLGSMVARLTQGVRKFEKYESELRIIIPPLFDTSNQLISMIDADTYAFNDYIEAMRLPKSTDEEKSVRENAMQVGLKKAIEVPLKTMKLGDSVWQPMIELAKYGNLASKSDVEVGARSLETGIWGAYKNVLINLPGVTDDEYKKETLELAEQIKNRANSNCGEVLRILENRES